MELTQLGSKPGITPNLHERYHQANGHLEMIEASGAETLLGVGFAGNDSRPGVNPNRIHGYNNPDAQGVKCIGPLPRGWYTIGKPFHHPGLGPLTFILTPDPANAMCGRDSLRMHGASATDPANSSEGCIVQAHDVRVKLAELVAAGINRLEVVA